MLIDHFSNFEVIGLITFQYKGIQIKRCINHWSGFFSWPHILYLGDVLFYPCNRIVFQVFFAGVKIRCIYAAFDIFQISFKILATKTRYRIGI
ncbi:hypothetical protein DRW42_05735 [Pedobacter miscanthi]|uniref:Uncharacterized protein n=1 Tax=Pedobacter miscanthi TaxID=2259170 RepID=A0A366L9Y0_9SPHI|nr:hypothetical protein DRW42_05735 [Pedobacter miscanthi]